MSVRDLDPYLIFYGKFPIVTDVKNPVQQSSYEFVVLTILYPWSYFFACGFRMIFFFFLQ